MMGEHRRKRPASDYAPEQTEKYRKMVRGRAKIQKLIRRKARTGFLGRLTTEQYVAAHAAWLGRIAR